MNKAGKNIYSIKRPSHPADAHTKAKRFFKKKGRKRARAYLKRKLTKEFENVDL